LAAFANLWVTVPSPAGSRVSGFALIGTQVTVAEAGYGIILKLRPRRTTRDIYISSKF
jgi:hypothetical protein